ncbi:7639_t:CDS:1 [Gigaspora margarita]|uniref:7639_t:CDS:1 n=1 Tax=Gigaspora margarita TaxID=4874 RepID=A0ABN7VPQ1_GIGMA|nr:7639_t:CDS:1 [Gigaspora margarita]
MDTTLMTTTKALAVVNNTTTNDPMQLTIQQPTYVFITVVVIIGFALLIIMTYIPCHKRILKKRKLNNSNTQQLNDINRPNIESQEQFDKYILGPNYNEVNKLFGNK